jgi:hypothetical protein
MIQLVEGAASVARAFDIVCSPPFNRVATMSAREKSVAFLTFLRLGI